MPTDKRGKYDHKEPGIYKISPHVPDTEDDRFRIRLRNPAGGWIQEVAHGRRYASDRKAALRQEARGGGRATAKERGKTVRELLEEIIASKNLRPNTITSYRDSLDNHIIPKMGHIKVAALVNQELFLTGFFSQVERTAGRQSRRLVEMHVRAMLRVAVRTGLLPRNPLDGVRWAKINLVRGLTYRPTTDDLHAVRQRIATATNGTRPGEAPMTLALTDLLAGTGLRISEGIAVATTDVDKAHGMLTVKRQIIYVPLTPDERERGVDRPRYFYTPPKTDESGDRRVPLPGFVTASLATSRLRNGVREIELPYVESADDLDLDLLIAGKLRWKLQAHPLFFFSVRGHEGGKLPISNPDNQPFGTSGLRARLRRSGKSLELSGDLHPHCYRHYYTTMLSEAGVPQRIIDHVTGHIPKGVTNRVYTHVTDPGLETARRAIEAAWGTPGQDAHEGISISS